MKEIERKLKTAYEGVESIHKITEREKSYEINDYFHQMTQKILLLNEFKNIKSPSIDEVIRLNKDVYNEFALENYDCCYGNPKYCQMIFGDIGYVLSAIYYDLHKLINYRIHNQVKLIKAWVDFVIHMYELIKEDKADQIEKDYAELRHKIQGLEIEYTIRFFDKTYRFYEEIIENRTSNLIHLYSYGEYITENEIKLADRFNHMDDDRIKLLAQRIVESYVKGFKIDNKDISKRSIVCINGMIGQERLIHYIIKSLADNGLYGKVIDMKGTSVNKQLEYDHRFDKCLYFDDLYVEDYLRGTEHVMTRTDDVLDVSGFLLIETFGHAHHELKSDTFLKMSDEQIALESKWKMKKQQLEDQFMPETDTSFCIVAFPCAEIHEDYDKVFDEVININMLDSDYYERIQQVLIDTLDEADYVWIKGKNNNRTDIRVKMYEKNRPDKESNFLNCGADVNIPVGEVFTTPALKETTGLLHVHDILLEDYRYLDLELNFLNGIVTDYNCKNYDEEKKNKDFILDNLLFPHRSLPMSEFAIGTNTIAYVMAKSFDIVDKLPILIVEKMGPHFAIGDTCYSWREETPIYNQINGKEIVAKDNEFSIKRKTCIESGYTNKHIDITIPYDDLDFIKAIKKDGASIDIILDGRFVLNGTESLNEPFDRRDDA